MTGNKIQYTLDFKANLTDVEGQLSRLKNSLSAVMNMAWSPGKTASADLNSAALAAQKLQIHLNKAMNPKTGTFDIGRFASNMAVAGDSVEVLGHNLLKAGTTGQTAFLNIGNALVNAQTQLFKTNTLMSSLWTTLKNTAKWQISSTVLTGFISGITDAIRYTEELDTTLNQIRIVSGDSKKNMDDFAKSANKAAKELRVTTNEFAKANLIFRQQGDSMDKAMKKAELVTKMANVSNSTAEEMSEYATAIWNSYKVSDKELELYLDKLVKVGAITATSSEEMATSMQKVAAAAHETGVEYNQLLGVISTVSSVTRESAEQTGTAFKTIFARMTDLKLEGSIDDGDITTTLGDVSSALESVGVKVLGTNGQLRDTGDILEDLGSKWNSIDKNTQSAVAQAVAGKRQYTQLMALMGNWDMYKNTMSQLSTAQGELNRQQSVYTEQLKAAKNELAAQKESLISNVVDEEDLIKIVEGFADLVEGASIFLEKLGGIGPLFNFILSIVLTKFAPKVASGFMTMSSSVMRFGSSFMSAFKGTDTIVQQHVSKWIGMIRQFQESGQFGNSQLSMEANNLSAILQIQQQIQARQQSMTESEKEIMNLRFEQLKQSQQILINKAKEEELTARIAAETAKNSAIKQTAGALASAVGGSEAGYAKELSDRIDNSKATTQIKAQDGSMKDLTVTIQQAAEMWDVFGAKQRNALIKDFSQDIGISENHIKNIINKMSEWAKTGMNVDTMLKELKQSYIDFAKTGNMSLVFGTPGSKNPEVHMPVSKTVAKAQGVVGTGVAKDNIFSNIWGSGRDKKLAQDVVDTASRRDALQSLKDNKLLKSSIGGKGTFTFDPKEFLSKTRNEFGGDHSFTNAAGKQSFLSNEEYDALGQQLTGTTATGKELDQILKRLRESVQDLNLTSKDLNLDEELDKAKTAADNAESKFENKTGGGLATEKAKQKARKKELKKKKKDGTATIEEQSELEGMNAGQLEKNTMMMSQAAGAAMQLSSSLMMVTSYWSMITSPDTDGLTKVVGLLGMAGTIMTTLSTVMPILNTLGMLLTGTTYAQAEAQAAANAAAYANPYVAIAAVIIAALAGITMGIMHLAKANNEAAKAEEKHKQATEKLQKSQEKLQEIEGNIDRLESLSEQLESAQDNMEKLAEATNAVNKELGTNYGLLVKGSDDYQKANLQLEERIRLEEKLAELEKEKALDYNRDIVDSMTISSEDEDKFTVNQIKTNLSTALNSADKDTMKKYRNEGVRIDSGSFWLGKETFTWEQISELAANRLKGFQGELAPLLTDTITNSALSAMLNEEYFESDKTVREVIQKLNGSDVQNLKAKVNSEEGTDEDAEMLNKLYAKIFDQIQNKDLRQELINLYAGEVEGLRRVGAELKNMEKSSYNAITGINTLGKDAAEAGKKIIESISDSGKVGFSDRTEYLGSIKKVFENPAFGFSETEQTNMINTYTNQVYGKDFEDNFVKLQSNLIDDIIEKSSALGTITEDNVHLLQMLLDEFGYVNSEEIAKFYLDMDKVREGLEGFSYSSKNAESTLQKLRNSVNLTEKEFNMLLAKETVFNRTDLDASQKILALKAYYEMIGDTENAIYRLLGAGDSIAFSNNIKDYASKRKDLNKIFTKEEVDTWFNDPNGMDSFLGAIQQIEEYKNASERAVTLSAQSAEERKKALKELNEELADLEEDRVEAYEEYHEELRNIEEEYKKEKNKALMELKKSEKEWADTEVLESYKETCEQLINITKELDDSLKQYDFEEKLNKDVESAEALFNRMTEVGEKNEEKAEKAKKALEDMLAIDPPKDAEALKEYNNTINELYSSWQNATLALKENNLEAALIAAMDNQGARLQEEFRYLDRQRDLFNQLIDLNKKTGIFAEQGRQVVLSQILVSNGNQSSKSAAVREKEQENKELLEINKKFNKQVSESNRKTRKAEIDQKKKERNDEWLKIHSEYDENSKEIEEKRRKDLEQAESDLADTLQDIDKQIEDAREAYNDEIDLIEGKFNSAMESMTILHNNKVKEWIKNLENYGVTLEDIFNIGFKPSGTDFTGGLVDTKNIKKFVDDDTIKASKNSEVYLPNYFGEQQYVTQGKDGRINVYGYKKDGSVDYSKKYTIDAGQTNGENNLTISEGKMAAGQSLGRVDADTDITVNKYEKNDKGKFEKQRYSYRYDEAGYKGTKMPKHGDIIHNESKLVSGKRGAHGTQAAFETKTSGSDTYYVLKSENFDGKGYIKAPEEGYVSVTPKNFLYFRGENYAFLLSVKKDGKQIAGNSNMNGIVKSGEVLEKLNKGEQIRILPVDGVNTTSFNYGSYAKGTDSAPGGISLVGEEGKELVINPDGTCYFVGKNGAEFVNLQPGAKVIPADETEDILNRSESKPIETDKIPGYASGVGELAAQNLGTQSIEQQAVTQDTIVKESKEKQLEIVKNAQLMGKELESNNKESLDSMIKTNEDYATQEIDLNKDKTKAILNDLKKKDKSMKTEVTKTSDAIKKTTKAAATASKGYINKMQFALPEVDGKKFTDSLSDILDKARKVVSSGSTSSKSSSSGNTKSSNKSSKKGGGDEAAVDLLSKFPKSSNERIAYDYFRANGMTDLGARATLANLYGESFGLNPTEKYGDAYGIVQWTSDGNRKQKMLKAKGKRGHTLQGQLEYLIEEMSGTPAYKKSWEKVSTPGYTVEEIIRTLVDNYEIPGDTDKHTKIRMGHYNKYFKGTGDLFEAVEANNMSLYEIIEYANKVSKAAKDKNANLVKSLLNNINYDINSGEWNLPVDAENMDVRDKVGADRGDHTHGGWDIIAPGGSPVYAIRSGKVVTVVDDVRSDRGGDNGGAGNYIEIDHGNGYYSRYLHLNKSNGVHVKMGDEVTKGQRIGSVGDTGRSNANHLHLEVRKTGNGYGLNGKIADIQDFYPGYASGTKGLKTAETAFVGELGPELAIFADGSVALLGADGVEYAHLPAGTRIFDNIQTEELLGSPKQYTSGDMNHFAEGTERQAIKEMLHGKTYLDSTTGQPSSQWPSIYMLDANGEYNNAYNESELKVLEQILDMDDEYVKQGILTLEQVKRIGELVYQFIHNYEAEGLTKAQADAFANSYNRWSTGLRNAAAETSDLTDLVQRLNGVETYFVNNKGESVKHKMPNLSITDENGTSSLQDFDLNDEYNRKGLRAILEDYFTGNAAAYLGTITEKEALRLRELYYAYILNNEDAMLAMGEYTEESMEYIKKEYGKAFENTKKYLISQNVDSTNLDKIASIFETVGTVEITDNRVTGEKEARYVLDKYVADYANDSVKKGINEEIRELLKGYSDGSIGEKEFMKSSYELEKENARRDVELVTADYQKYLSLYEELRDLEAPQAILDTFANQYLIPLADKITESLNSYEDSLKQILNDQYDIVEKYMNELSDRYEHDNNRLESLKSAYEERFSVLNNLADTQREINKQLRDAKLSSQWLTLEGRKQLFNERDHYRLTKGIQEAREEINAATIKYTSEISKLTADEWYKEKGITEEYNKQVAAQERKLSILQAEVGLEQKRNALTEALTERNVRVFTGGRWQQVANYQNVQAAAQDYEDQLYEIEQIQREDLQTEILDAFQEKITGNEMEMEKLTQSLDKMRKSIDDLFSATGNLTDLTKDELIDEISNLTLAFNKDFLKISKEINAGAKANTDTLRSHFANYDAEDKETIEGLVEEIFYQKVKYAMGSDEDKAMAQEAAAEARKQLEEYMSEDAIDKFFGSGVDIQSFIANALSVGFKNVVDTDKLSELISVNDLKDKLHNKFYANSPDPNVDSALGIWEYLVSNYDIAGTEKFKGLSIRDMTPGTFDSLMRESFVGPQVPMEWLMGTGNPNIKPFSTIFSEQRAQQQRAERRQANANEFYGSDDFIPALVSNFILGMDERGDGVRSVFRQLEDTKRNMERAKARETDTSLTPEDKEKAKEDYQEYSGKYDELAKRVSFVLVGNDSSELLEMFNNLNADQLASIIKMVYGAKSKEMAQVDESGETIGLDTSLWDGQFEITDSTEKLLELMIKENKAVLETLLSSILAPSDMNSALDGTAPTAGSNPINIEKIEMIVEDASADGKTLFTQMINYVNQINNSTSPGQ